MIDMVADAGDAVQATGLSHRSKEQVYGVKELVLCGRLSMRVSNLAKAMKGHNHIDFDAICWDTRDIYREQDVVANASKQSLAALYRQKLALSPSIYKWDRCCDAPAIPWTISAMGRPVKDIS
jgi:hypothetical protein